MDIASLSVGDKAAFLAIGVTFWYLIGFFTGVVFGKIVD